MKLLGVKRGGMNSDGVCILMCCFLFTANHLHPPTGPAESSARGIHHQVARFLSGIYFHIPPRQTECCLCLGSRHQEGMENTNILIERLDVKQTVVLPDILSGSVSNE